MMKYRTKLMLWLVALAVITNGVLVWVSYWLSRDILLQEIQSKVLSIAATTAALVDGDLHETITTVDDMDAPAYKTIEDQLRRVRDVNRRSGLDEIFLGYVYTLIPRPISEEFPQGAVFGVDAQEPTEGGTFIKSDVGEPLEAILDDAEKVNVEMFQIDEIYQDKYGTWLSANAPVRNSRGQAVAAVGVDLAIQDVLTRTHELLWRGLAAMLVAVLLAVVISMFFSRFVTRSLDTLSHTVTRIGTGDFDARADLDTKDEFGQLGDAINGMAKALRDRELLKGALARYLSYQVAEKVIHSGEMPELKGERRKVTVLFLDIRDFTEFADNTDPQSVVDLLNQFFERMIDVVFRFEGTLDKFTGDGLMAFFGAPFDDEDQEYHAVCAALHMQHEFEKLKQLWDASGKGAARVGMGINTGVAVVGNIGSAQRMDYTAIGDTVNLAARLEAATKEHNVDILISQPTRDALANRIETTSVGTIHVKGFAEPLSAYAVDGFCDDTKPAG